MISLFFVFLGVWKCQLSLISLYFVFYIIYKILLMIVQCFISPDLSIISLFGHLDLTLTNRSSGDVYHIDRMLLMSSMILEGAQALNILGITDDVILSHRSIS